MRQVRGRRPGGGDRIHRGGETIAVGDRLREWLSFVSTELHKAVFTPLLSSKAPDGAKALARELAGPRFERFHPALHVWKFI